MKFTEVNSCAAALGCRHQNDKKAKQFHVLK